MVLSWAQQIICEPRLYLYPKNTWSGISSVKKHSAYGRDAFSPYPAKQCFIQVVFLWPYL